MTHGPKVTRCQESPCIAPCGDEIRDVVDGQSCSTRFIDCAVCLRLGRQGSFALIEDRGEQLILELPAK